MSHRSAAKDPDLRVVLESPEGEALSPADRLAVHLLHEASKGEGSRWRLYIQQLPRHGSMGHPSTRLAHSKVMPPGAAAFQRTRLLFQKMFQASHRQSLTRMNLVYYTPMSRLIHTTTRVRST